MVTQARTWKGCNYIFLSNPQLPFEQQSPLTLLYFYPIDRLISPLTRLASKSYSALNQLSRHRRLHGLATQCGRYLTWLRKICSLVWDNAWQLDTGEGIVARRCCTGGVPSDGWATATIGQRAKYFLGSLCCSFPRLRRMHPP